MEYVWVHSTTHDVGAAVDVRKSSDNLIVLPPPVVRAPDKMGQTVMEGHLSFDVTTFQCEPSHKLTDSPGGPPAQVQAESVSCTGT